MRRRDPQLLFWNIAAAVVFGAGLIWMAVIWAHPSLFKPMCHPHGGATGSLLRC